MGIKLQRKKPRMIWGSMLYRLSSIFPLGNVAKQKLFLNLEWMFDRLAHETSFKNFTYENHPVRQYSKPFILSNIRETSVVLDLGCGDGEIANFIAEKAKKVVGVDYNKKRIEIAQKRWQRPNLAFYNREALEFLNNTPDKFDTLILSHILEHLDNPKEFLDKFKSYFQYIFIELPDFEKSYLNYYRKALNVKLIYTDDDHVSEFDRDELKTLVTDCGMEVIKEEYRFGLLKLWCKTGN
jgi:SAM-dependent methyltransferase